MKKKFMIIEDNKDLRHLYSLMISHFECESKAFSGGHEALQFLFLNPDYPDLILVDLYMPDMDGEKFIQAIRGNNQLKKLKIYLCSGVDDLEEKYEAFQADGFLSKPISLKMIEELCKKA